MFDITKEEKEYIERYINKKFDQNDFFIFNIKLCDNEVDEDLECFSVSSLEKLALLYKGKLGILNLIDESQYPRIFNCKIKKFSNKKTKIGNNYIELIAKAYIPINKETENIIYNIKNNLLKEISVGCLIKKTICSICGKERFQNSCKHKKGEKYNNILCVDILEEPLEVYEWAFVKNIDRRLEE